MKVRDVLLPKSPGALETLQSRLPFVPLENTQLGRRLSVATWPDGSRAVLDGGGLLHLRSSDPSIPECSIVLHDGETAGWVADGKIGLEHAALFEQLCATQVGDQKSWWRVR